MEILQESREYQAAKQLEDALNSYLWNPQRFAMSVPYMHRTLQQTLFRTIVTTIKLMASDDYPHDLRNQKSHEIARKIVESGLLDDAYIPFI